MWRWRQRLDFCGLQPSNAWSHWTLEEARKDSPLELRERVWSSQHLAFGFLPMSYETIHSCWFKPLRLLQQPWEINTTRLSQDQRPCSQVHATVT